MNIKVFAFECFVSVSQAYAESAFAQASTWCHSPLDGADIAGPRTADDCQIRNPGPDGESLPLKNGTLSRHPKKRYYNCPYSDIGSLYEECENIVLTTVVCP